MLKLLIGKMKLTLNQRIFGSPSVLNRNWRKERGKTWHDTELFLISIEREADKAHVKCGVIVTDVENGGEWIKLSCLTKMLKIGSTWKIKEQILKNETK